MASPAQRTLTRDPADIHICILTQTESQVSGISTIVATIDGQAPDLSNVATQVTSSYFTRAPQSTDTYKASNVTITMFINILIGIKVMQAPFNPLKSSYPRLRIPPGQRLDVDGDQCVPQQRQAGGCQDFLL